MFDHFIYEIIDFRRGRVSHSLSAESEQRMDEEEKLHTETHSKQRSSEKYSCSLSLNLPEGLEQILWECV